LAGHGIGLENRQFRANLGKPWKFKRTIRDQLLEMGDHKFERVVPLKDETITEWLGHELGRLSATPTYNAALEQLADAARAGEAYAG
jgi:hypothetical protein